MPSYNIYVKEVQEAMAKLAFCPVAGCPLTPGYKCPEGHGSFTTNEDAYAYPLIQWDYEMEE